IDGNISSPDNYFYPEECASIFFIRIDNENPSLGNPSLESPDTEFMLKDPDTVLDSVRTAYSAQEINLLNEISKELELPLFKPIDSIEEMNESRAIELDYGIEMWSSELELVEEPTLDIVNFFRSDKTIIKKTNHFFKDSDVLASTEFYFALEDDVVWTSALAYLTLANADKTLPQTDINEMVSAIKEMGKQTGTDRILIKGNAIEGLDLPEHQIFAVEHKPSTELLTPDQSINEVRKFSNKIINSEVFLDAVLNKQGMTDVLISGSLREGLPISGERFELTLIFDSSKPEFEKLEIFKSMVSNDKNPLIQNLILKHTTKNEISSWVQSTTELNKLINLQRTISIKNSEFSTELHKMVSNKIIELNPFTGAEVNKIAKDGFVKSYLKGVDQKLIENAGYPFEEYSKRMSMLASDLVREGANEQNALEKLSKRQLEFGLTELNSNELKRKLTLPKHAPNQGKGFVIVTSLEGLIENNAIKININNVEVSSEKSIEFDLFVERTVQ
ncbi:MAG: hypothetical protein KAS30_02790, partial [Candidatus Diapherotrites archaeon]|nr:hypothetical protein [Candidatus Diapherotrites archaeon]